MSVCLPILLFNSNLSCQDFVSAHECVDEAGYFIQTLSLLLSHEP